MTRTLAGFLTLVFLSLFAAQAEAQPDDDARAKELYEEAEASYAAGGYDRAVELFTEAYELSKRPALLFNIANAEERRGNHREAAKMLKRYLESPGATDIDAIGKRIKNLDRRADEADARQAKRDKAERDKTAVAKKKDEPEQVVLDNETPSLERDDRPSLVPGYALVAVGGVLIVGGITSAILSNSASNDAEARCDATGLCPAEAEDDINKAKTLALVADVALVAGVASAAVGTYLLIRRRGSSPDPRRLSLDVGPTNGGAAAVLRGTF